MINAHETLPAADDRTAKDPAGDPAAGGPAGEGAVEVRDLYLPFGGTDPDFYIPADRDRTSGGISRWFRALPVFGRRS